MTRDAFEILRGDGPLVATAIHDGHAVREQVAARLALDDAARRREEDPFTSCWVNVAPTQIVVRRSRFEFDLNRPREQAVYLTPEDAWGLEVWKQPPDAALVERSLAIYDAFYQQVHALLGELVDRHGKVVVLDLHSYNHRRDGPEMPPADRRTNPEVNLGTGSLDRQRWAPVVETAIAALHGYPFPGHHLDIRENARFRGGHFVQWIHRTFPTTVCGLAIEFKKTFMDEWTGQPDPRHIEAIRQSLLGIIDPLLEALGCV